MSAPDTTEAEALIAQAKELDAKATKAPWRSRKSFQRKYKFIAFDPNNYDTSLLKPKDADFIAFARDAIPAFARLLREAMEREAELRLSGDSVHATASQNAQHASEAEAKLRAAEAEVERLRRERDVLRAAFLDTTPPGAMPRNQAPKPQDGQDND